MPLTKLSAYIQVQANLKRIVQDRVEDGDSIAFNSAREAMLLLHCEWQDLMTAVKGHDISRHAALAALRLAAAAWKFAEDLGDPKEMKAAQIEQEHGTEMPVLEKEVEMAPKQERISNSKRNANARSKAGARSRAGKPKAGEDSPPVRERRPARSALQVLSAGRPDNGGSTSL